VHWRRCRRFRPRVLSGVAPLSRRSLTELTKRQPGSCILTPFRHAVLRSQTNKEVNGRGRRNSIDFHVTSLLWRALIIVLFRGDRAEQTTCSGCARQSSTQLLYGTRTCTEPAPTAGWLHSHIHPDADTPRAAHVHPGPLHGRSLRRVFPRCVSANSRAATERPSPAPLYWWNPRRFGGVWIAPMRATSGNQLNLRGAGQPDADWHRSRAG
jgi:hypothetical protein